MGKSDYLKLGSWNVNCDICGFKFKADQVKLTWNGFRSCTGPGTNNCWEARNQQEFVRGKADRQAPPWTRPDAPGIDVSPGSGNEVKPGDL